MKTASLHDRDRPWSDQIRRRGLVARLVAAAAILPLIARAQQKDTPVIGILNIFSPPREPDRSEHPKAGCPPIIFRTPRLGAPRRVSDALSRQTPTTLANTGAV